LSTVVAEAFRENDAEIAKLKERLDALTAKPRAVA
jgi:hypothetical protein